MSGTGGSFVGSASLEAVLRGPGISGYAVPDVTLDSPGVFIVSYTVHVAGTYSIRLSIDDQLVAIVEPTAAVANNVNRLDTNRALVVDSTDSIVVRAEEQHIVLQTVRVNGEPVPHGGASVEANLIGP